jgi:hypothetical protein
MFAGAALRTPAGIFFAGRRGVVDVMDADWFGQQR